MESRRKKISATEDRANFANEISASNDHHVVSVSELDKLLVVIIIFPDKTSIFLCRPMA